MFAGSQEETSDGDGELTPSMLMDTPQVVGYSAGSGNRPSNTAPKKIGKDAPSKKAASKKDSEPTKQGQQPSGSGSGSGGRKDGDDPEQHEVL